MKKRKSKRKARNKEKKKILTRKENSNENV